MVPLDRPRLGDAIWFYIISLDLEFLESVQRSAGGTSECLLRMRLTEQFRGFFNTFIFASQ